MTRVEGWTATSRGEDPYMPLNDFVRYFNTGFDEDKNYPAKRSGHRCFTDNDYFYLIGGYCTQHNLGRILKELWVMSLVTFEWRRYAVRGNFPDSLASFAIVQLAPYANSFLLFGGSGTNFGASSSNSLYLVRVNNEECFATSEELQVEGEPPSPMYGHAMCAGEVPGKYYIIGGTEGTIFNFDVTSVTMKLDKDKHGEEQCKWHYKQVSQNEEHAGRYRLEVVYDEKLNSLLFFGGGNSDEVFGFDKIIAMNVGTNLTEKITAFPDRVHGFPKARRCHTLVCHNRNVIITGGVKMGSTTQETELFSDVWVFNLDTFTWRKLNYSLPEEVFFHNSVMTRDGWFLTFGGVHGATTTALRNNMLYGAWFDVPSLHRFAIESLRNSYPKFFSGLYCGNFHLSDVLDIVMVFLKKGRVEEKEKHIIAQSRIKFYEEVDRSRHYLNEDAANYMIGGKLDEMQWKRRDRDGVPVFIESTRPDPEQVKNAIEMLIVYRNNLGECEITREIDEIRSIWQTVENQGAIREREVPRQIAHEPQNQQPNRRILIRDIPDVIRNFLGIEVDSESEEEFEEENEANNLEDVRGEQEREPRVEEHQ